MRDGAVYSVSVLDDCLVYAPLQDLTAVVNRPALDAIRAGLGGGPTTEAVGELVDMLCSPGKAEPERRTGPIRQPLFLGIIPTRGCNMACSYCDFGDTPDESTMTLDTAKAGVDAYFDLLEDSPDRRRAIHFFGGEPLHHSALVDFVVGYARSAAADLNLQLHLELSTNGFYGSSRARSVGEQFDSVVLSFDGPASIQDRNRPAAGGRSTFDQVLRTAEILSDSSAEFVIRTCVTEESLPLLVGWADFIACQLRPSAVCFERLTTTVCSQAAGLRPPDPWEFARQFVAASHVLERYGIAAVTSTTDITRLASTCCPVGQDALIVSPDGAVNACYLLESQWVKKGLDLRLGRLGPDAPIFLLDPDAVAQVRALADSHPSRCRGCLCRLHCAGGCHVDHRPIGADDGYDDLCISTRAITVAQLLIRCGQTQLADSWLESDLDLHAAVLQPTDLLEGVPA